MSINPAIYVSIYPAIYPSIKFRSQLIQLSIQLYKSIHLTVFMSIKPAIYPSIKIDPTIKIYPSSYLSICVRIYIYFYFFLSFSQSIYLTIFIYPYIYLYIYLHLSLYLSISLSYKAWFNYLRIRITHYLNLQEGNSTNLDSYLDSCSNIHIFLLNI